MQAKKRFEPAKHTTRGVRLISTTNLTTNIIPFGPYMERRGGVPPPWQREPNAPPPTDTRQITDDVFWELIRDCRWANKSDGVQGSVSHIKRLSTGQYDQFIQQYEKYYDGLKTVLDNARVFMIRGITDQLKIRGIVSHIIGLGREQYTTIVTGELAFMDFFIDGDQCVSLDALL